MHSPEKYAEILKNTKTDFIEAKAYMHVGYSILRLGIEAMPRHYEVRAFAEEIAKHSGLKILDEKQESRVILLGKKKLPKIIIQ